MSAFDPAAWLASFEAVGGWYVITDSDSINVGWRVFGEDAAAQIKARALYNEIAHYPDRQSRVRAFIMDSHRGLALAPD